MNDDLHDLDWVTRFYPAMRPAHDVALRGLRQAGVLLACGCGARPAQSDEEPS